MSAAQDSERIVQRIGVYRLEQEIGSGAMGKVYRATHETLGKPVALKVVHADDPSGEVSARFLQEGIAASRVRHPNVVEILDAGTHRGTAYLAMQLLEGETLAECLSRQGRLPPTYAVDLILPVCAALTAAHEAGVLHRDLKPANIFLSDVGRGDPEPILVDFGISKILGPVDPELTQNPRFLGSPLYIAPEQADGAPGSPRSDQYSLALTLYEALLGVRPFAKYSASLIQLLRHVAEGDIRRPRELDASIPDELDQTLCRALSTDPRERFPSVREFGAALLPFASQARRTLWQQSFVDAERTMASANAPVSDSSRSSRRVHVSVEGSPTTNRSAETHVDPDAHFDASADDFLSHSSLFGRGEAADSTHAPSARSVPGLRDGAHPEAERSSISRRDPYSQSPSDRPSGAWAEHEQGTHPSLERKPATTKARDAEEARSPTRSWAWILAALVVGVVLFLTLGERSESATFPVAISVHPRAAIIEIDGQVVGTGHYERQFARDGKVHRVRVSLRGHEPQTIVFRDQAPLGSIELAPLPTREDEKSTAEAEPEARDPKLSNPPEPASAPKQPKGIGPAPLAAPLQPEGEASEPPPSDPEPKEVSTEKEAKPAQGTKPGKPSIQTGNLDPWAE